MGHPILPVSYLPQLAADKLAARDVLRRVPHVRLSVRGTKTMGRTPFERFSLDLRDTVPERTARTKVRAFEGIFFGPCTLGRTWGTRPEDILSVPGFPVRGVERAACAVFCEETPHEDRDATGLDRKSGRSRGICSSADLFLSESFRRSRLGKIPSTTARSKVLTVVLTSMSRKNMRKPKGAPSITRRNGRTEYRGKQTRTGNFSGFRFERALFKSHPEFDGKVTAHVIAPGRMLVMAETRERERADPVMASFLAFLAQDISQAPQGIRPLDAKMVKPVNKLTKGVAVSPNENLGNYVFL